MDRTVGRRLLLVTDRSVSERVLAVASSFAGTLGGGIELLELATFRRGVDSAGGSHVSAIDRICARLAAEPMDVVVCADHEAHRNARSAIVDLIDALLDDGVPVLVANEDVNVPAGDLPVVAYVGESPETEVVVPTAARWANSLGVPLVLVTVTRPSLGPPQVPSSLAEPRANLARVALKELAGRTAVSWPELDVSASLIEYRWEKKHALALFLERNPAQLVVLPSLAADRPRSSATIHGNHLTRLIRELAIAVLVVPGGVDHHWPFWLPPPAPSDEHA